MSQGTFSAKTNSCSKGMSTCLRFGIRSDGHGCKRPCDGQNLGGSLEGGSDHKFFVDVEWVLDTFWSFNHPYFPTSIVFCVVTRLFNRILYTIFRCWALNHVCNANQPTHPKTDAWDEWSTCINMVYYDITPFSTVPCCSTSVCPGPAVSPLLNGLRCCLAPKAWTALPPPFARLKPEARVCIWHLWMFAPDLTSSGLAGRSQSLNIGWSTPGGWFGVVIQEHWRSPSPGLVSFTVFIHCIFDLKQDTELVARNIFLN